MEIYFSPELIKPDFQILNVIDSKNKAVGYLSFLFDEKKMYVYGCLENEGVREDFKDMIVPYINGMKKSKQDMEVYSYIAVGGKKLELEEQQE